MAKIHVIKSLWTHQMRDSIRIVFIVFVSCFCLLFQSQLLAEITTPVVIDKNNSLKIAIIIDDLGHKYKEGVEAINLDIPLAVAVLPFTPHGKELAKLAHEKNQDVMLHLPMQPGTAMHLMTENTLSIQMMQKDFHELVSKALDDIPHVIGVNNHMGSLFTQLPDQMQWLMQSIKSKSKHIFFIDSFTSQFSIAYQVANKNNIATARRDVFLDRQLDAAHMQAQISTIKRTAKANGYAIAIGHPFPETLALLEKSIPELRKQGFEFVKISELLGTQMLSDNLKQQIELQNLRKSQLGGTNSSASK